MTPIPEETCPGCGEPVARRTGDETIFVCGTGEDAGYFGRDCWANQCAQARDRITELEEFIRGLGQEIPEPEGG